VCLESQLPLVSSSPARAAGKPYTLLKELWPLIVQFCSGLRKLFWNGDSLFYSMLTNQGHKTALM